MTTALTYLICVAITSYLTVSFQLMSQVLNRRPVPCAVPRDRK